ncbi:MAG: epoxyqueuosine reductase QueH [Lachnospiraceae bacterium]|nr:epoxyqueuosine reductase QueH [Lachnospiraceae bacterium]MBR5943893.1 epoxyqueuosine reductase QueH [Lachnospiraceae bacterium]
MANVRNYQKELEAIMADENNRGRKLLLHACCAPCSSYCLEYLKGFFEITVFYYNPNITYEAEYKKRVAEEKRLIEAYNALGDGYRISYIDGDYEPEVFLEASKGLENCPEGGERCLKCFELRLSKTAEVAKKEGFDFFSTTLTISPLKNAEALNEIGERMADKAGIRWLPSDFKKKNGYKRSIELSKEYDLYRQDYCGCAFSKAERERSKANEENK